jgi:hypothetical protein
MFLLPGISENVQASFPLPEFVDEELPQVTLDMDDPYIAVPKLEAAWHEPWSR